MTQTQQILSTIIYYLDPLAIIAFAISFQFSNRKLIKLFLCLGFFFVGGSTLCQTLYSVSAYRLYLSPVVFSFITVIMYSLSFTKLFNTSEDFKLWPLIYALVGIVPFAVLSIAIPKQDPYSVLLLVAATVSTFFAFDMKSDRYMRNMHIATSLFSVFFYYTNSNTQLTYAFIAMLISLVVGKIRFERGEAKNR